MFSAQIIFREQCIVSHMLAFQNRNVAESCFDSRSKNNSGLGRDALNALKLPQMLKPLARNMTFSFQKQALSLPDVHEGYKKIRKEGLRNRELKAFRKLGI
jgi:hypothetical protein